MVLQLSLLPEARVHFFAALHSSEDRTWLCLALGRERAMLCQKACWTEGGLFYGAVLLFQDLSSSNKQTNIPTVAAKYGRRAWTWHAHKSDRVVTYPPRPRAVTHSIHKAWASAWERRAALSHLPLVDLDSFQSPTTAPSNCTGQMRYGMAV